ncbi:hypothetical protein FRB95_001413 [Tulasnella sp. JGI-2019a]|nr:hypothetical protein FRB95_001413 [Tulasnella sp. JGI-2019a]
MRNADYLGSDDLDDILAQSALSSTVGPLHRDIHNVGPTITSPKSEPAYILKPQLTSKRAALTAEISSIDNDIAQLQSIRAGLQKERADVDRQLESLTSASAGPSERKRLQQQSSNDRPGSSHAGPSTGTDYTEKFEWSGALKQRMNTVFGIQDYRLCQEGVCNANMDGRDIVCVMPTGGGKSLTYQLPALLSPGCTLVVSPLISLITDQILHLREAGIEAVKLTGGTSKEETKSIFARLTAGLSSKGVGRAVDSEEKEIKLCYVTPEKIAKSKVFTSVLEKMATAGRLARIVIDEAHCVSQLGHDFRPDYKKLSILRQLFPHVPILALSATCPPKVLQDILMILRMKAVVDGRAANRDGTVYFAAPLYRKNLHYRVVLKPSSASAAIKVMSDYILQNHQKSSGIVYCLSKKDTETIAAGLFEASGGVIQTGVYHSDVGDAEKEKLHVKWREGKVKVVCATIAFGLGIDKGDVRFVLHHSMSKSLEGFYQESGRAGRDGKDSDCVLYFRAQDASRLSSLTCAEVGAQGKLHDMLRFALDKKECRKIAFANYFSSSSSLSLSSWSDTGSSTLTRCGHCDNCTRPPESVAEQDVTVNAWRLCKVAEQVSREGGRLTVAALGDLARGNGGASFGIVAGGKGRRSRGKTDEKASLDLDAVCGGKVTLSKDDVEMLIIQLILSNHLKEDYHSTAYSINVYVQAGPQSLRITRMSYDSVKAGTGERITLAIATKTKRATKSSTVKGNRKAQDGDGRAEDGGPGSSSGSRVQGQRSLAEVVTARRAAKVVTNGKTAGGIIVRNGKGKANAKDVGLGEPGDYDMDDGELIDLSMETEPENNGDGAEFDDVEDDRPFLNDDNGFDGRNNDDDEPDYFDEEDEESFAKNLALGGNSDRSRKTKPKPKPKGKPKKDDGIWSFNLRHDQDVGDGDEDEDDRDMPESGWKKRKRDDVSSNDESWAPGSKTKTTTASRANLGLKRSKRKSHPHVDDVVVISD